MNRRVKDLIIVGFALFSMFLGAGNLIFPPYLGLHAGDTWFPVLIGFIITGVGLPLMTVYATLRSGGTIMTLARYAGRPFGRLLGLIRHSTYRCHYLRSWGTYLIAKCANPGQLYCIFRHCLGIDHQPFQGY